MKPRQLKIIKFILISSSILVILAAIWHSIVLYWTPIAYQKTSFSEEERTIIISVLGSGFNEAEIDELRFAHGKDNVNYIFVSNVNEEMLQEDYSYVGNGWGFANGEGRSGITASRYQKKNTWDIECYVYKSENDTDTKAIVYIGVYVDELYNIVKDN